MTQESANALPFLEGKVYTDADTPLVKDRASVAYVRVMDYFQQHGYTEQQAKDLALRVVRTVRSEGLQNAPAIVSQDIATAQANAAGADTADVALGGDAGGAIGAIGGDVLDVLGLL